MRVVALLDFYVPGWRAGGPIRSIANLVEAVDGRLRMWIITSDRDLGQSGPYAGVPRDTWTDVGAASVYYASRRSRRPVRLGGLIREISPDVLLGNSLFSPMTQAVLIQARFGRLRMPIVLAPRGELAPGPLAIKRRRKRLVLSIGRLLGVYRAVRWQASTEAEAAQISGRFPRAVVEVVPDLPQQPAARPLESAPKHPGAVVLAWVARIAPIKNLPFLLEALQNTRGQVRLLLVGPVDAAHWRKVEPLLRAARPGVEIEQLGPISHRELASILESAHFLVLPTLGENFGHAIWEALSVGRPVVISDRTPWRGLADKAAGWDLPLESPGEWAAVLQECIELGSSDYEPLVRGAHAYALAEYVRLDSVERQLGALERAIAARGRAQSD